MFERQDQFFIIGIKYINIRVNGPIIRLNSKNQLASLHKYFKLILILWYDKIIK